MDGIGVDIKKVTGFSSPEKWFSRRLYWIAMSSIFCTSDMQSPNIKAES